MTDRIVRVPAERLAGWLDRFGARHGDLEVVAQPAAVLASAADGATAAVSVPFPPLPEPRPEGADLLSALVDHVGRPRSIGAILVRRGGYAVGIFAGAQLIRSKVGSSYVQGKTKAGGWSQQRYARRRANQAAQAYAEVADVATTLLAAGVDDLDAVVGGGDRAGVEEVLGDPRLIAVRARWTGEVWPTADPRLRVLQAFPEQFRAVSITLNELA